MQSAGLEPSVATSTLLIALSSRCLSWKLHHWTHSSASCWRRPLQLCRMLSMAVRHPWMLKRVNMSDCPGGGTFRSSCTSVPVHSLQLCGFAEFVPRCRLSQCRFAAGVYVGCMYHEYIQVMASHGAKLPPQAFIGNGPPYLVGRLSYAFGLTGPCVSTDTACSSSLVATHLAHQGMLAGETPGAVVGGINIMLRPETTAGICQLRALSAVGRCRQVLPLVSGMQARQMHA